jgi:hypothetical protein
MDVIFEYNTANALLGMSVIFLDNNVDSSTEESDDITADEEMITDEKYKSPDQISSELITLSLLPGSRWKSLLHLDVIKVRNECRFVITITISTALVNE